MTIPVVRLSVWFTALYSLFIAQAVYATTPRDSDKRIPMVVGEQRIIHPPFDSQIAISKKGVVNVKWISGERILLTALKSGVILIDPTPVSQEGKRLLVEVKTPHQAKKHHVLQKSSKYHSGDAVESKKSLETLLAQSWFQEGAKIHSPSEVIVDCFHPAKDKVLEGLAKHFSERFVRCKDSTFLLHIKVKAKKLRNKHTHRPVAWLSQDISLSDDALQSDWWQEWKLRVTPSKDKDIYKLARKGFSVNMEDLRLYASKSFSQPWTIQFSYTIKAREATSSGHVLSPYAFSESLLLSELVYDISAEKSAWNTYTENLPIFGVLMSASEKQRSKEAVQVYVSLSRY